MKRIIGAAILALGTAAMLAPTITPAAAQEWRREEARARQEAAARERDREWRIHERRAEEWRRHHYESPGYVYAAPPVVYAPPPAASFSLVVPFR
jgi:Ni/Co efflux regulator RcnB